jgi:hypothetical protein
MMNLMKKKPQTKMPMKTERKRKKKKKVSGYFSCGLFYLCQFLF